MAKCKDCNFVNVRVPKDLRQAVQVKLDSENRTMTDLIVSSLRSYVADGPTIEQRVDSLEVRVPTLEERVDVLEEKVGIINKK